MTGAGFVAKCCRVVGTGALVAGAAFTLWTRNCHMDHLPATDAFFHSKFFNQFNPTPAPTCEMRDICTRRFPLRSIRPELVEDARRGGSTLIESFTQGIWSGFGYAIQRYYLHQKYGAISGKQNQLWSKQSLRESKYETGTQVTDHMVVLDKNPTSILMRAGSSPHINPDSPRGMDGLIEIQAIPDFDKGYVDFKFKTAFFVGTGFEENPGAKVVPLPLEWGHRLYTKLLVETGLARV